MKKFNVLLVSLAIAGGINAQSAAVEASKTKAISIVETSLAQQESYDDMYGVLVARLDEAASDTYESGSAEISFSEFMDRLDANSEEQVFTADNGNQITIMDQPSIALLDDGFSAAPPAQLGEETVLDYVTRLSELVATQSDGYHDYVVIATTGGDSGLVYARVEGQAGEANSIDEANGLEISIFPNPVSDVITVKGLPVGTFPGQLVDVRGKIVMQISVTQNQQLDLGELSAGLYTFSVLVDDQIITEKIQVRR